MNEQEKEKAEGTSNPVRIILARVKRHEEK
jgi:hypothetical protein